MDGKREMDGKRIWNGNKVVDKGYWRQQVSCQILLHHVLEILQSNQVDTVSNSSSLNKKNDRIPGLVVDLFTLACAQERIAGHHLFCRKKNSFHKSFSSRWLEYYWWWFCPHRKWGASQCEALTGRNCAKLWLGGCVCSRIVWFSTFLKAKWCNVGAS